MLLSQVVEGDDLHVVVRRNGKARVLNAERTVYSLALEAARSRCKLADLVRSIGLGRTIDLEAAYRDGNVALPISHPDPTHMYLTGTGLTHLGSAAARDAMHGNVGDDGSPSDTMKMFRLGLSGGKPPEGAIGTQPEWFYKGNGHMAVAPGMALISPHFAEDAGEEPEVAGIYVIGDDGMPLRIGFALANELSDHLTERANHLWLAHSKLRNASFGPEIFVGDMPANIHGKVRIRRGGEVHWQRPFLLGEANMAHSVANLEYHHFKYQVFRQPGDVHIHMFGTATMSFADGVCTRAGDIFEIEASDFGLPLRNPLKFESANPVRVTAL